MRKLALKDAFTIARILKAANLREAVVEFAKQYNAQKGVNEIGFEFILTLISSISDPAPEKMIYRFYADLKGVEPEEVEYYGLETLKADYKELVELNDLKSFFNFALPLISKQLNS